MKKISLGLSFVAVVFCLGMVLPNQAVGKNANPGIIPPKASYGGMTLGDWTAHYYYHLAGTSIDPAALPDEGFNPKNIYFPKGKSVNDPTDHFDEYVPAGHAVMIMVLGNVSTTQGPIAPEWGEPNPNWVETDLEYLQNAAEQGGITCAIDGVPVQNLKDYVVSGTFPHNLVVNDPTYGQITFDSAIGCSLILRPLTPGYHIVHIEWADWVVGLPFNLTYNIFVKEWPDDSLGK
jgi:hypothetical protein